MVGGPGGKKTGGAKEDSKPLAMKGKQSVSDNADRIDSPGSVSSSITTKIEDNLHGHDHATAHQVSLPRPQASTRGSWSWRAKATPVASVAKESIFVEQGVSSESAEVRRPSPSVSKSMKGSRKSVPLVAEATRVHATSDGAANTKSQLSSKRSVDNSAAETKSEKPGPSSVPSQDEVAHASDVKETIPDVVVTQNEGPNVEGGGGDARPQSGSWLKWWSRPDGYGSDTEKIQPERVAKQPRVDTAEEETSTTQAIEQPSPSLQDAEKGPNANTAEESVKPEMTSNPNAGRSWFGLWSHAQNEQAAAEQNQATDAGREQQNSDSQDNTSAITAPTEPAITSATSGNPSSTSNAVTKDIESGSDRPKPSGWAFWSMDKATTAGDTATANETQMQVGELAVADTPSQSHPEAAQFNEQRQERKNAGPTTPKRASSLLSKASKDITESPAPTRKLADSPATNNSQAVAAATSQAKATLEHIEQPVPVYRNKESQARPNLILPSFRDSFSPAPTIGYLDRLTSYLAQSFHIPGAEPPRPPTYPYISRTPHKVKKAIAIGIHGFFPAAVFNRVIGQPTGTSIRFAGYAAASIKEWCQQHQPDVKDVRIEKVALEGEGNIAERVTTLWKLLLNWLSHLRQADFILVAAHSQGVPVATMLVAKLLQLGALAPNVRIGICGMAGINLGPFIEYKSRLFGNTALELFDFCDSTSKVSIAYADAVDVCLRNNVRITYIGSLDDQLVSLESSLHAPLSHPYVSRAVFIDGRLHTSNFLTHLVVFSVKLRNRGISDHGLLREISAPLAGSLVGGEGHSRVYDDPAVYTCAAEFALESTDMHVPAQAQAVTTEAIGDDDRQKINARRASLSGYPREMAAANLMRRGSLGVGLPGIAPIIAPYHVHASTAGSTSATNVAEKNPFVLPWAVRGMLEEEAVKKDPELQAEVHELVWEFEQWRPTGKGLKDVRWRLEGVRSLL